MSDHASGSNKISQQSQEISVEKKWKLNTLQYPGTVRTYCFLEQSESKHVGFHTCFLHVRTYCQSWREWCLGRSRSAMSSLHCQCTESRCSHQQRHKQINCCQRWTVRAWSQQNFAVKSIPCTNSIHFSWCGQINYHDTSGQDSSTHN